MNEQQTIIQTTPLQQKNCLFMTSIFVLLAHQLTTFFSNECEVISEKNS